MRNIQGHGHTYVGMCQVVFWKQPARSGLGDDSWSRFGGEGGWGLNPFGTSEMGYVLPTGVGFKHGQIFQKLKTGLKHRMLRSDLRIGFSSPIGKQRA